jgi:hypothetical protein
VIAITKFQFFLRDRSNKKIFTVLKKDRSASKWAERFVVFWLTPPFFKKNNQFARAKMG